MEKCFCIRYPYHTSPIFLHFDGSVLIRFQFNAVFQKFNIYQNILSFLLSFIQNRKDQRLIKEGDTRGEDQTNVTVGRLMRTVVT